MTRYCCPIQFANLENRETLVLATGFRFRKLTARTILIAVAVATSCRWVFSKPIYLDRRIEPRLTPCEIVPSIPALFLYSLRPASLASFFLVRSSARYISRPGICRDLPAFLFLTHWFRLGQFRQSLSLNLILTTGRAYSFVWYSCQ